MTNDPQNWSDTESWGWENYDRGGWDLLSEGYLPKGQNYAPDDLLWCRETWSNTDGRDVFYKATISEDVGDSYFPNEIAGIRWRSPVTMPKWASRITLRVTSVEVRRVQTITEAEAEATGVLVPPDGGSSPHVVGTRDVFGPAAFDANPWCGFATVETINRNVMEVE